MGTENKYCLYQHTTKTDGNIFYIGIGDIKRPFEKSSRNKYWKNIVKKYDYDVNILVENISWERACELEIIMISFYGRKDLGLGCLVNMTDGGEGTTGRIKSEEEKRKISEANKGRVKTEEERIKMSERAKSLGCKPPSQKGYKHSNEVRKKISIKIKGRTHSEETIKKMSNSQKGHKVSDETKKNMSIAQKSINNKPPVQWGKNNRGKIVMDINTGIFYESGLEVANLYNINKLTLCNWLNGKRTNRTPFRYV